MPVVIVTNNAAGAALAYLDRLGLLHRVRHVVGRPERRPDHMKPNTHMVEEALRIASAAATEAVLMGDSVSDVQVAHAAGVHVIGHAKNPRRGQELRAADADALTESIDRLY